MVDGPRPRWTVGRALTLFAIVLCSPAAGLSTTPAAARPGDAKLVRLPLPKYDGTLTPYSFEGAYPLVTLVYDTLLWRDAKGVPRPWLARSVKRTGDGRRLTIRLRKGVRWHDGRPLTAADVAFTFQFVGGRFHPRFTPQLANVERVQAVDRLTVTIDLRRRSLGFDDQPLADLPILPRHLWEGLTGGQAVPSGPAVGSGPYRLHSAQRSRGYVFLANKAYFKGRPRVGRIRVPIIRQEDRTYSALRRQEVDMLPIGLPEDAARELGGAFDVNLKTGSSYAGTALLLNLRRPPFDSPAARRAVAQALDLGRIVRNVGPSVAADRGYIHPASAWSSDAVLHRFDRRGARATLARLGRPAIRVLAPETDPVKVEAGRQVMLSLRRTGTRATLVTLSRDEVGEAIGEDGSPADFEAAIVDTPPLASYDPDFLANLFGSGPQAAPLNYAGYSSGTFNALAARVATASDREARLRGARSELRLLARDLPVVPLFFAEGAFAYRPAVYDGWVFIEGVGIFDKRSFLPNQAPGRDGPDEDGIGPTEDSGTVLDVIRYLSLLVLVVALALGAVMLRRRSVERR